MRLLLIEDDESLCLSLSYQLRQDGFAPETCHDGEEGLLWARQQGYDLILLDRMLPGMDGLTLLRQLRREGIHTPVIFLTALGQLSDKTGGLDAGADDYIAKPFGMMELIARIRAVLRRTEDMQDKDEPRPLVAGGICVDERAHTVFVNEQEVQLTLKEYQLLCLLMKNRGAVLTRDVLLENIWGYNNESETRTVDVHIRTLRQKLGADGALIETVRGVGYRMGEHT